MIIRGILTRSTFNLSTTGLKVLCTETNDPTENIMFFLQGEIARQRAFAYQHTEERSVFVAVAVYKCHDI